MRAFMIETLITIPLLARAAPMLLPLAATLCKHLLGTDDTLFKALIETCIDEAKDASKDKLEEALKKKPDLVLALNHQVFMRYTGWVLGALIRQFGQQPQFADYQKDLERFADQAPDGWITFVLKGSPGFTPVQQDVFLREMAASMARDGSLPPVSSVPFTIFFNWHIRLPGAVQQKLDTYLKTHLDNAIQVLLLNNDPEAQKAYKQIILSGVHGIQSSLGLLHRKLDVTVPVIVETNQTVKIVQQQSDLMLGQLADALKGNSAESRITQYKRSLLNAFSAYQELALDNYSGADQACPDIWDIFVHPACATDHLRPEDMDAAQREKPPRLPAADLLPLLAQDDHRRTVLLADPGMGKSTLIQSLIAHLASGRPLAGAPALNGLLPVPLILRDLVSLLPQDQPDSWTWDSLITALLEQYQREETAPPLLEAYRDHAAEFRELINNNDKVFFLIDGLDEIGDFVKRRKIVECIQDGIRAVSKEARWLITSRVIGFEDCPVDYVEVPGRERWLKPDDKGRLSPENWNDYFKCILETDQKWKPWIELSEDKHRLVRTWSFKGLEKGENMIAHLLSPENLSSSGIDGFQIARRLYLAPFDDKRQDAFTSRWFRHRHSTDYSKELMREVRAHHHDGVRIISRVPNLLCMMNMLKRSGKPLPDGRAALYDEIVKAYLGGIDAAYKLKPIIGHACPFEASERRHLLSLLGAHMQQSRTVRSREPREEGEESQAESKQESEGNILISVPELETLLIPAIEAMQQAGKVKSDHRAAALLDELLHHIASRSGLLIPRSSDEYGNSVYGFTHLSFLEFFAAEWLGKEFDRLQKRLARRAEAMENEQTLTEVDLDREFPAPRSIEHKRADFPVFAASPAWHEPLIFLVESRKNDTATLLRWLFPALHAPNRTQRPENSKMAKPLMPVDAVRIAVQLAHDQELSISPETRRHWWRTLWTAYLTWPHNPWDDGEDEGWPIAPLLLGRAEQRTEALQALAEVYSKEWGLPGPIPAPSLCLYQCSQLTTADLTHLSRLTTLERLDLFGCTGLESVPDLSAMKRLKVLDLSCCPGLRGPLALIGLTGLGKLETLDLSFCTGLDSLPDLSALEGLHWLQLGGCTGLHGPQALSGITRLGQLEYLCLNGCTGLESLPDLSAMQSLRRVDLQDCAGLKDRAGLRKRVPPGCKIVGL